MPSAGRTLIASCHEARYPSGRCSAHLIHDT
ncbi:hypothetical protein CKO_01634 [Citrobacter koseri ATCC BAA-895]|uniref:Uncharacterized protein n=1 Tax=Citrobacter koseri (strain ATCC BAA-895 / CDC 4225-83 / SGSC4696) TaxID=290338 RepID=A8AH03_CITK8|nr:hypothetical protein CKO_01634 [Citrobacter koseri ATCC BAA-895]